MVAAEEVLDYLLAPGRRHRQITEAGLQIVVVPKDLGEPKQFLLNDCRVALD